VLASLAAVEAAIVLAAGRLLFGIPVGSPLPVATALVALALATAGLRLLLATVLPTSGAGTTVAGPLAFVAAGPCRSRCETVRTADRGPPGAR
jgi:hypothetical protein